MRLIRVWLVVALALGAGVVPAAGDARAAPAAAAESVAPEAVRPDDSAIARRKPFIDNNVVFLACASGASLGALITGLPPVIGWIPYAGAPTQISALVLRMALGCYYGIVAGVAASGTYSAVRVIRDWWSGLF